MSPTEAFIRKLGSLKEGERSRLRRLAGQPLDRTLAGFDLFTGLWWPLREKSAGTLRRETSWLLAKLYGAFPIPYVRPGTGARPTLPVVLGRSEPRDEHGQRRFRSRFEALLCSPLSGLEPHLRWALRTVAAAVEKKQSPGLDWAQLLDDLSVWDRADEHRRHRDIRDLWAEDYLNSGMRSPPPAPSPVKGEGKKGSDASVLFPSPLEGEGEDGGSQTHANS